jgi:peptidoglycan/LPS O-acetylase OafA/YrhL
MRMSTATKTRAATGIAAVITGVMLIGTTGLTFAFGWALWAVGLAMLLLAAPSAGGGKRRRRGGRDSAPARYALVR